MVQEYKEYKRDATILDQGWLHNLTLEMRRSFSFHNVWQLSLPSLWEWIALFTHLWILSFEMTHCHFSDWLHLTKIVITTTSLRLKKSCCVFYKFNVSLIARLCHNMQHSNTIFCPWYTYVYVSSSFDILFIFLPVCPHLSLRFLNLFESIEQGLKEWKEQISLVRGFLSLSISSWILVAVHHLFQVCYLIYYFLFRKIQTTFPCQKVISELCAVASIDTKFYRPQYALILIQSIIKVHFI